ncbi:MAG: type II toxin-antitoxin system death-on-curing family toxin [Anaerolineales bacterium]
MIFLTTEQVLFIHSRIISETGGSHGVRDLGLLESAVARPRSTYEGRNQYPDLFAKAAALMHSLVNNHPFVDGNKRTGVASAALFLRRNGWKLTVSSDDLESITLRVTSGNVPINELSNWLRSNSVGLS